MSNLFQNYVIKSGPVECLGQTFQTDDARREHYLKLLAKKLKDSNFRKIEGFPAGSDEAILAISDPPYFTACPNPWLEHVIKYFGSAYDPNEKYLKTPFSADVTEGKNHALYSTHSYHTKVPHRAIMRYMLHYTKPGDVVLDGFGGSGMTGVAAAACGSEVEIKESGFIVKGNKAIDAMGAEFEIGMRHAIISDLSPIASFIAANFNNLPAPEEISNAAEKLLLSFRDAEKALYATEDENGKYRGILNYVIWSDAYVCQECSHEYDYWSQAVVLGSGEAKKTFPCPSCGSTQNTRNLQRAYSSFLDPILRKKITQMKQIPVFVNYFDHASKKQKKAPSKFDLNLAENIPEYDEYLNWIDCIEMTQGDRSKRDAFSNKGVTHVHHFYTWRNLKAICIILKAIDSCDFEFRIKQALRFVVTSFADRNGTKRNRFVINEHNPNGRVNGPMANTLYLPNLFCEMNIFELFREKLKDVLSGSSTRIPRKAAYVNTSSSTQLAVPDNSIDYIFTDPPFGHNIQYSELNQPLEAFIRVSSNLKKDIVVNEVADKSIEFYKNGIRSVFLEYYRVLKPGRWITVEFSNTQAAIWNSIQTVLSDSGFVIASVAALDKTRGGMHSTLGVTAVKQDLIITAYKPTTILERDFIKKGGTEDSAWDFALSHLKQLPILKIKSGELEFVVERDPRILYDRMVSWFVRHNTPVPLSTQEFQAGLRSRYVERDGMIFLQDQIAEYDKKRAQYDKSPQLELFVSDERSAIDWLSDYLKNRPSTYQELHPEFIKQLGAGWKKHESKPELDALLENNFLKFEGATDVPSQIHSYLSSNYKDLRGLEKNDSRLIIKAQDRWYVPDPNKAQDLEKKRDKALLKEFEEYQKSSGRKLKEFRLEVLRAGFKIAWGAKNYKAIIDIAQKIPEEALQEDEKLLLWYDQALTRSESAL
jgi:DNA modification methylase